MGMPKDPAAYPVIYYEILTWVLENAPQTFSKTYATPGRAYYEKMRIGAFRKAYMATNPDPEDLNLVKIEQDGATLHFKLWDQDEDAKELEEEFRKQTQT